MEADPVSGTKAVVRFLSDEERRQRETVQKLNRMDTTEKLETVFRRSEFERYEAKLAIRLGRLSYWKSLDAPAEDTTTEVIALGGALVRSRMVVERGEVLVFEVGSYRTRAEVMYVAATKEGDPTVRLGLRFLDAPLPESLFPPDARPLS